MSPDSQPCSYAISEDDEHHNLLRSDIRANDLCDEGEDVVSHPVGATEAALGPDIQPGVENIEAVTAAWTNTTLVFAYVMIWLIYFVEGLLSATTGILTPYVTSTFAMHSFTPTVGILSSVVGGVTNLTLAKVLDVFGRPQGYLLCIICATVGLAMMAACNGVEAYAAAQVFQTVGNNGILYSLTVFVADTSSLRNRGLMQAIVSSPNLVTGWLAGPFSSAFLVGAGWRWAFGAFTILVPVITLPLFQLLLSNFLKAKMMGLVPKRNVNFGKNGSTMQTFRHYGQQFDVVGLVLLSVGVAVFLLPFNLYSIQGWNAPLFAMLIAGSTLIACFVIWEKYYATNTFIPYCLLLDRTVLGACALSATLFISFWCWNSFFSSYLQVVNNLSVENANNVVQAYAVCSVLSAIGVGFMIHYTGRFKPVCLYLGIPLSILGSGLMIYQCRVDGDVGYIIMCQLLISMAAGIIMVSAEVAILAAASHQQVAICIAVLGMFGNVGGAVGLTLASAIWQSIFPNRLAKYLPAAELPNLEKIYANISMQLSYPIGSEARLGIQHAYKDAQMSMLAVSTTVWVAGFLGVAVWRDINVIGIEQNKGHVW